MKFSIVIPTYNRANFIEQTILDIINQSYDNWELIIIDDGSTDNTKEVVSKFTHDKKYNIIFKKILKEVLLEIMELKMLKEILFVLLIAMKKYIKIIY